MNNYSLKGANQGANQGANFPVKVRTKGNLLNNSNLAIKEVWLTVSEGANLLKVSKRAVQKNIKNGKYTVKLTVGNGGKQYRILLSSLPLEVQKLYWDINKQVEPVKESKKDILTEKQETYALAAYELVLKWRENRTKYKSKTKADKEFDELYNTIKAFKNLYDILGSKSTKTIRKWDKKLRENSEDYYVLAPNYNYGKSKTVVTALESKALIKYLLHPNKFLISEVIRFAKKELELQGIKPDKHEITYRRFVNDWIKSNYDVYLLHREGEKALNDKNLPYLERDKNYVEVGDLLVIDGHVLNFDLINPATGKLKRMILIMVYDYKSDFPLGWSIMPTENVYSITVAVRRAILRLGFKGRVVNIDNGRANKSKWFLGDLEKDGIRGLFRKIFDDVLIAQPYHGESKTVERFFGTFAEMERSMLTYTGTSIANKPPHLYRNEKLHTKVFNKYLQHASMTIEDGHFMVASWCEEYVNRPHQGGQYKGLTPLQIFNESLERVKEQPDFNNRIITKEQLDFLLMPEKITSLSKNGLRLPGYKKYFFHPELYKLEKGSTNLIVKYDPMQLDSVLVYRPDGSFLCEAIARDKVHPIARFTGNKEDEQLVKNYLEEKNSLKKQTIKSFNEHFKEEILPEIEENRKVLEEKETKRIEKRKKRIEKELNIYKIDEQSDPNDLILDIDEDDFDNTYDNGDIIVDII